MAKIVEFDRFLIIEATAREMYVAVGSPGLCDYCGNPAGRGYYIAVLNKWFCENCFETWKSYAQWYHADADIERRNFDYYAPLLGIKCQ